MERKEKQYLEKNVSNSEAESSNLKEDVKNTISFVSKNKFNNIRAGADELLMAVKEVIRGSDKKISSV